MTLHELQGCVRVEGWLGREIALFPSVSSTNDIAQAAAREGVAEGFVVIADVQTAGRGRMQRRWQAPAGSSLLFSLVFHPPQPFAYHASRTMMAVGLALVDAVRVVAGIESSLKWPNDLIVTYAGAAGDGASWGKLAGMLAEVVLTDDGNPAALVVGVGLNVNVPAEDVLELGPHASSLLAETGGQVNRAVLLTHLLDAVEARIDTLRQGVDPLPVWRRSLAWLGQPVEVLGPEGAVRGVARGVDCDGALLVQMPERDVRRFSAGDVTLRPGESRA